MKSENSKKGLEAGLAGAGGGTLFVLLMDFLPQSPELKALIAYLTPTVSVALSATWLFVRKVHLNYRKNKKYQLILGKIDHILTDSLISEKRRKELLDLKDKIQEAYIQDHYEEIKNLYDLDS